MKAYIGNVDWADEGDVFFFSIENEDTLEIMKTLLITLHEFGLFDDEVEMYWGTNESFEFTYQELLDFINDATEISEEEIAVFNKFRIKGFDIYDQILDLLSIFVYNGTLYAQDKTLISPYDLKLEEFNNIKTLYTKLFGLKGWNRVERHWKEIFLTA